MTRPFPQDRVFRAAKRLRLTKPYLWLWQRPWFLRWLNRSRISAFREANFPSLNDEVVRRIADDMRKNGVAFAALDEFFGARFPAELERYVRDLDQRRRASAEPSKSWYERLNDETIADADDAAFRLATDERFITIGSSYLELIPLLREISVIRTNPYQAQRTGPQRWHRDPDDFAYFKLTILVNGYSADNPVMEYVPGTHFRGAHAKTLFRASHRFGEAQTFDEAEVERAIPAAKSAVRFHGPPGTMIFFDTSGLHRSSYDPNGDRLIVGFSYNTRAYLKRCEVAIAPSLRQNSIPLKRLLLNGD